MRRSPARSSRLRPLQSASLLLHGGAALALVPAFVWLVPASGWHDPFALAFVWALAIVADRHEIPLPGGGGFDALLALVLVAVVMLGPLPAFGVMVVPWAVNVLSGRERLLRRGALANFASYGWQAIAVWLILAPVADAPPQALAGWLIVAGAAAYLIGWIAGPVVYGRMWTGTPMADHLRALVDLIPAGAMMIVMGAATAVVLPDLGFLALIAFASVAVLPQSALTLVARTRSVAALAPAVATRRYAHALGLQLGLSRADRRAVDGVAAVLASRTPSGDSLEHVLHLIGDPSEASCLAGHVSERWDGRGGPAGLAGTAIPGPARIAAVAQRWSELTAAGGPELGHREALVELERSAALEFDPTVVGAVAAVIAEEPVSADVPAPEPRLHRFGVPAPLRRALAAGAAA